MLQANPPNPLIMDAVQLRANLLQRIEEADEKLLRVINSVIEAVAAEYAAAEVSEETIIGYQAGESLTTDQLKAKVNIAEEQIDRGEYLTPEELEKEAEEWLSESIG